MSNDNPRRRAIDDAIDRAVRDMMQIDPAPGLRRRVLGQIERRSASTSVFGTLGRQLAVAVALVAIILAVALWPGAPSPSPTAPASAGKATALRQAQDRPEQGRRTADKPSSLPTAPRPATALSRSASAPSRATVFGPRRDRVSAASIDRAVAPSPPARDPLAALPSVPLIVLTPLRPMPELRVTPLDIQPLTIPPLSPPRK